LTRTTGIEWTEHTWNPFVGCSIHTPGCTNCYAMRLAARIEQMGTTPAYDGTTRIANGQAIWTGRINRSTTATWRKPLAIRSPSMIFVNSMSDFWHEAANDDWRLEALEIMRATPRHQYQVLTKRPENIAPFLERTGTTLPVNFWAGATVERGDFKHRIDTLRRVPARIRFLSIEPLIGPLGPLDLAGIHWAIVGGESGAGARPMKVEWLREVRDQCVDQGVRLFLKQFGIARNNPMYHQAPAGVTGAAWVARHDRIGKGGSTLDGRRWTEYPA
jgi:protein gp37